MKKQKGRWRLSSKLRVNGNPATCKRDDIIAYPSINGLWSISNASNTSLFLQAPSGLPFAAATYHAPRLSLALLLLFPPMR